MAEDKKLDVGELEKRLGYVGLLSQASKPETLVDYGKSLRSFLHYYASANEGLTPDQIRTIAEANKDPMTFSGNLERALTTEKTNLSKMVKENLEEIAKGIASTGEGVGAYLYKTFEKEYKEMEEAAKTGNADSFRKALLELRPNDAIWHYSIMGEEIGGVRVGGGIPDEAVLKQAPLVIQTKIQKFVKEKFYRKEKVVGKDGKEEEKEVYDPEKAAKYLVEKYNGLSDGQKQEMAYEIAGLYIGSQKKKEK